MHQKFISLLGSALEIAASRKDFELVHSLALAAKTFSTKTEEEKDQICSSLLHLNGNELTAVPEKSDKLELFKLAAVEFSRFPPFEPDLCELIKKFGFIVDSSWHNDACPSFSTLDQRWSLWVDHPDKEQREITAHDRFSISEKDRDGMVLNTSHNYSAETLEELAAMLAKWAVDTAILDPEIISMGFDLFGTGGGCEAWHLKSGEHYVYLTANDGSTARGLNRLNDLWLGYYLVDQDHSDHLDFFESKWEKIQEKILEFKSGKWAESQSDKPAASE